MHDCPVRSTRAQGGGVRVNNRREPDELAALAEADLIEGRLVLLAAGKKNKLLLRVTG
jgi:tyrosyl-tRNA synthetase